MQRVIGALLNGEPVPEDIRASLTDEERAEAARIAATAALTRTVLQAPVPPPQAEEASLRRAQEMVSRQPVLPQAEKEKTSRPSPQARVSGWLARWRRKG